jgi:hypothetical protein
MIKKRLFNMIFMGRIGHPYKKKQGIIAIPCN